MSTGSSTCGARGRDFEKNEEDNSSSTVPFLHIANDLDELDLLVRQIRDCNESADQVYAKIAHRVEHHPVGQKLLASVPRLKKLGSWEGARHQGIDIMTHLPSPSVPVMTASVPRLTILSWHRHPSSRRPFTPASANASTVAEWQVKKMIWRPAAKSAITRAAAGRR